MPINANAAGQSKIAIDITQNPNIGDTIEVKAIPSSSVKKVTWSLTLNGTPIKINFKKTGGTFIAAQSGAYLLTCTVSGKGFSETYTQEIIVSEANEVLPPKTFETEEETSSENTSPDNNELMITLEAPTAARIDVPFTVSIATSNCSHIEWYINGDYDSKLTTQINPEGTLLFSTAGIYEITVIGYTKDWSEHVKDTKSIIVTDYSSE